MKAHQLENYRKVKEEVRPDTWCVSIVNHFRASFGPGESDEHRDKKYERWCYWRKKGFNVVTEAILTNGLRPDLIIFNGNEIFIEEIVNTEKKASIEKKKENYPYFLNIIEI